MQDNQLNTFDGGLNRDADYRTIKPNEYVDALNVNVYSTDRNSSNSISPLKSSALAFDVPEVTEQLQITRLYWIQDVDIEFSMFTASGALVSAFTIAAATNTSWAAFEAAFTAELAGYGYVAQNFDHFGSTQAYFKFEIVKPFIGGPTRVSFLWQVDGVYYDEVVLQEAYLEPTSSNFKYLKPVASYNVEGNLFLFSETEDEDILEFGIATNESGWVYTRIFRTWRFTFPILRNVKIEAVDIRVESVSDDNWAIYFTDNSNKPKVLYVQKSFSEDCVIKWTDTNWLTATDGYLIYNEIDQQTNLQLINNAGVVSYQDQEQSGGSLVSGGYRYTARFGINGTENMTEWSVLTPNVIPVFKTSIDAPSAYIKIQGDKAGTQTTKANVIKVQNCLPNIFNFVELACVYSAGGATSAYIVGRYPVTSDTTYITHSGSEATVELDATTIPEADPVILTAKSLEIKKNRLNIANVTVGIDDDISSVISGASITQGKYEMDGVGRFGDAPAISLTASYLNNTVYDYDSAIVYPFSSAPNLIFANEGLDIYNEYDTTTGVFTKAVSSGSVTINLVINYTTPVSGGLFFIVYKNGSYYFSAGASILTAGSGSIDAMSYLGFRTINLNLGDTLEFKVLWYPSTASTTDSITITTQSYISFANTIASSDFSLTRPGEYQLPSNCATKVGYMLNEKYPFYIRVHYKNGYISSPIYIGMFDNAWNGSDKDLYTTGSSYLYSTYSYYAKINGIDVSSIKNKINGFSIWRGICNPTVLGSGALFLSDELTDDVFNAGFYASIPTSPGAYGGAYSASANQRYYSMFFSHDTRIAKQEAAAGDTVRVMDNPLSLNYTSATYGPNPNILGSYAEYYGEMNTADVNDYTVTDGVYTGFENATGTPNENAPKLNNGGLLYYSPNINTSVYTSGSMENLSLAVSAKIATTSSGGGNDNGIHLAQYIRPLSQQYDTNNVHVVPTGVYINTNLLDSGVIGEIAAFGGDVYTQKNIVRVRYWSTPSAGQVRTSFITYYAQNRINTQLFYNDNTADKTTWNLQGCQSVLSYLFPFTSQEQVVEEQFNYDEGYSAQYPFFQLPYDSSVPQESMFATRIYYSEQKPINSVNDYYRKIKSGQYKDLDSKNGEIAAIRDINNYMVAIQPRAISILPYLSDVAISPQGSTDVLIGSSGVYVQRENIVSTYGTSLQTCVLSGQNSNGNSILYWYSPDFHVLCRYGSDGVKIISDDKMRTYFLAVSGIDKEYDMVMTYDTTYRSVILTYPRIPETLMYSEKINAFTTFTSFQPQRYFQWQNITLAPNPSVSDFNQVHELFGGTGYLEYFGIPSVFRIDISVNKGGVNDKRFIATGLSIGDNYIFTDPTITLSTDGTSFNYTSEGQKRYGNYVAAFKKYVGQQPISQFGVIRIVSDSYIEILGIVSKWRQVFRSLFK